MLEVLGLRFRNTDFLYLLLVIPFTVPLWRAALRRKRLFRLDVFGKSRAGLKVNRTSHLSHVGIGSWKYAGYTLILLALGVALLQPQVLREKIAEERSGVDTVLALDLSYSMKAEDIAPSRLEKAKEVIRNFIIEKRAGDRIGLVTFAENSLILSYLTRDPENLLFYLDYAEPNFGTNIGRALKSALRVFEKEDELAAANKNQERNPANSRSIILVSDGEDTGHELEEAITAAARSKIKIYCIGIGSRRAVPIPISSREGGIRQYLRDSHGQVFTRFNDTALREIAGRTGGKFYRSLVGYEIAHAFDEIMQKEMQIKDLKVINQYEDIYHFFLVSSLGLFFFLLTLDRQ